VRNFFCRHGGAQFSPELAALDPEQRRFSVGRAAYGGIALNLGGIVGVLSMGRLMDRFDRITR